MNIAVIFAGGVGSRMHSKILPKQFLEMHGKPIIVHTIDVFEASDKIDGIVIACIPEWINYLKDIIKKYYVDILGKIGGEIKCSVPFLSLKDNI